MFFSYKKNILIFNKNSYLITSILCEKKTKETFTKTRKNILKDKQTAKPSNLTAAGRTKPV